MIHHYKWTELQYQCSQPDVTKIKPVWQLVVHSAFYTSCLTSLSKLVLGGGKKSRSRVVATNIWQ